MSRGEQDRRRLATSQEMGELSLGRLLAGEQAQRPLGTVRGEPFRQRLEQLVRRAPGCLVARRADPEKRNLLGWQTFATRFRRHYVVGIGGIVFGLLEMDSSYGILDVQLVLEAERNLLGIADDQQVIGHVPGVGRAGAGSVEREKLLFGLVRL